MKKQKIIALSIITLIIVSLCIFALPTKAYPVLMYSQPSKTEGSNGTVYATDPASGDPSKVLWKFTLTNTGYVRSMDLYVYRGSANAIGTVHIYLATTNASNVPVTTVTDFGTINITSWGVTSAAATLTHFTPVSALQMTASTAYVLVMEMTAGPVGAANGAAICDQTGGTTFSMYYTNAWNAINNRNGCIVLFGDTTAESTPTPSPTGNPYQYWNGTAWVPYTLITPEPNIFDNGTATPYIQMLVPVIILAVAALLGWKFAGAWGFFLGINIGAILTYAILGSAVFPLWGIVVLLIVDGLLLFGKVGFRS